MEEKTLILHRFYTPDSNALWSAAIRNGWDPKRLSKDLSFPEVDPSSQLAVYGDGYTTRLTAEKFNLFIEEPPLDWLINLPERLTKRSIAYSTLGQLSVSNEPRFIKSADIKYWKPRVYVDELPDFDDAPMDAPILIQEPLRFANEFRFFVLDREIRTSSQYMRNGNPSSAPDGSWVTDTWDEVDAKRFLNAAMQEDIFIPSATVIDVGYEIDRGWLIIEANPCCEAGIYGCSPDQVLEVVAAACRRKE